MASAKVKKGDVVRVIAGKDKGKTGKVLTVMPKKDRVIVDTAISKSENQSRIRRSIYKIKSRRSN